MPAIAKTTSCSTVATNMMAPNLTRTSLRSAGTEAYTQGQGHAGPANELEESPSVVTEAARSRYRKGKAERYATNKDGKHVDSERGFAAGRRRIATCPTGSES